MLVELEPHVGRSVRSTPENPVWVRFDQYWVYVTDERGKHLAGVVGTEASANIAMLKKFTPLEIEEIQRQVAELKRVESVKCNQKPDIDIEAYEKELENRETEDDYELDS